MPEETIEQEVVEQEENLIEVPVGDVEEAQEASVDETEGLSEQEISRAKELGLIEEKEEVEEKSEEEPSEEEKDVDPVDPESFEEMEKEFDKNADEAHKKFSKNAKGLYFRLKKEKLQRQNLARKVEELTAEQELKGIKESVSAKKLEAIREALADPELTVEKLNAIIGEESGTDSGKLTREEVDAENRLKAQQAEAFNQRVVLAEQIGVEKYPNFQEIVNLAQEEANNDKMVQEALGKAFADTSIDEETLVEKVVKIARMNDKFKDVAKLATPQEEENIKRAIKNSQKPKSSASLGGSGKVMKREDELTPDDAGRMSTKQFLSLSQKTRDRLRMEALK